MKLDTLHKRVPVLTWKLFLASQAHHVPHVGFPQIAPVTNAIILKTNPEGAKLFAIKKKFLFLKMNPLMDKKVMLEKIPREIQAAGT
jgi:hypothetical protein